MPHIALEHDASPENALTDVRRQARADAYEGTRRTCIRRHELDPAWIEFARGAIQHAPQGLPVVLVFVRQMYEGSASRRRASESVRHMHSTTGLAFGGKSTFYRTTKERRRYPTEAHQPIELTLCLTCPACTTQCVEPDQPGAYRSPRRMALPDSCTHRFECMLGKVQVARGREHPKVCGSGYDSRQRIRGVGHTVHERAGIQAGLEHVAGGQQHPDGRCANRRRNDEVAIEWWIS
jgi:hypothetical protein